MKEIIAKKADIDNLIEKLRENIYGLFDATEKHTSVNDVGCLEFTIKIEPKQ